MATQDHVGGTTTGPVTCCRAPRTKEEMVKHGESLATLATNRDLGWARKYLDESKYMVAGKTATNERLVSVLLQFACIDKNPKATKEGLKAVAVC
jgi:hypothetical protein